MSFKIESKRQRVLLKYNLFSNQFHNVINFPFLVLH
uniref:Uncharacterized protein n=1 Tax=Anguilla anguilla TaxID=7936 RepID=A0A0E9W8E3_ANGAN